MNYVLFRPRWTRSATQRRHVSSWPLSKQTGASPVTSDVTHSRARSSSASKQIPKKRPFIRRRRRSAEAAYFACINGVHTPLVLLKAVMKLAVLCNDFFLFYSVAADEKNATGASQAAPLKVTVSRRAPDLDHEVL